MDKVFCGMVREKKLTISFTIEIKFRVKLAKCRTCGASRTGFWFPTSPESGSEKSEREF